MSGSVPETQDEVFVPLVRIILHQVPQNWPAANRVTIGLEIVSETSRPRVPNPPQNSTTFHGEAGLGRRSSATRMPRLE